MHTRLYSFSLVSLATSVGESENNILGRDQ